MKKKHLLVVLVCMISLLLAACSGTAGKTGETEENVQQSSQEESVSQSGESSGKEESVTEASLPEEAAEEKQDQTTESIPASESEPIEKSGYDYTWTSNGEGDRIGSGELVYSLKKVRVVDSLQDMPGEEEHFFADYARIVLMEDGKETVISYPDYVKEDGSFDYGAKLLLAEIEVKSNDAAGLDDAHGYSDPYLFRADTILYLQDTTDNERTYYMGYFDGFGAYEEHSLLYRLEPGETTSITIGFVICERMDGNPVNLLDLQGMIFRGMEMELLDLGL